MPRKYDIDMKGAREFAGTGGGYPFAMLVASIIVIVAAAILCSENDCDGDGELLALIGGIVLFVLVLIYMCIASNLSDNLHVVFIVIFFLGWALLAGFTTFENPFFVPGNGYFAAWLGFFAATGMVVYNVRDADRWKKSFLAIGYPLSFLVVGSIVVIIAGIAQGCCNGDDILAIIAGTVSLVVTVIYILLMDKVDPGLFAVFILGWWLILGLIITFSVFEIVGNGFFATWVCMASALYLCLPHV